jgi:hypothetical protein
MLSNGQTRAIDRVSNCVPCGVDKVAPDHRNADFKRMLYPICKDTPMDAAFFFDQDCPKSCAS